jgi:hypothetical protein
MTLKQKFQALVDKIETAAIDLTTLDVVTLSGDINLALTDDKKGFKKPLDIAKEFYGTTDGKVTVEAFTHIDLDHDTIQFFKEGLTEDDLTYMLHQNAVDAAQEARMAFLEFVRGIVS